MKVESTIFDLLSSGKLGNTVGGTARGGIKWLRSRVIPSNPQSSEQSAIRSALSSAAQLWGGTLSQAQRDAWNTYAANVLKGGLSLTGANWFTAAESLRQFANTLFLNAGTPWTQVLDGPTTYQTAGLTAPVPSYDVSSTTFSIDIDLNDEWASATNPGQRGLMVWCSPPVSPSREFQNVPYTLIQVLQNESPQITDPQTFVHDIGAAAGDRLFMKFRARLQDGRFSPEYKTAIIAVA